jgi:hypothetical protein
MDAPFLVRRQEVEHDLLVAVRQFAEHLRTVLVSIGGRHVTKPSPNARIQ